MLASIFSLNVLQTALELGCIYGLVALALFLSYSILNIADLSTDGCFTLGCAVACQVALTGHPLRYSIFTGGRTRWRLLWLRGCAPALSPPFCRQGSGWKALWPVSLSTPAYTPSIWQ